MIKAILYIAVTLGLCLVGGVVFGFWKAYEAFPFWLWLSSLMIFVLLIVAEGVLIYKLWVVAKEQIADVIIRVRRWLRSLTIKDIFKILKKLK